VEERAQYARFWQKKLASNKDIEFPDAMCVAVAEITDKFSFAYIQEAFVASLLAIAHRSKDSVGADAVGREVDDGWIDVFDKVAIRRDLDKVLLWVEMKKQVALLREGIEDGNGSEDQGEE
jgi:transitional endoplasmic reticulum ATPase